MPHKFKALLTLSVKLFLAGLGGVVIILLVVFVLYLNKRPDLNIWHTARLDAEFTTRSPVDDFKSYLELEDRLFKQLDERIYSKVSKREHSDGGRYVSGNVTDPRSWTPNWNRSFELMADKPRASVLLLHGLSDSPYSLRALGQRLNAAGAHVVGLRVPGHGTAPSGLVELRWQSMAAAVQLAVKHLHNSHNNLPIHLIGYSTGGALSVHYMLSALEDPSLPAIASTVLLSPAIGVSRAAVFAVWQARLGHLLGLEKLAWSDIQPEYDPYKYNSFAVNGGDLVYQLTDEIRSRIETLGASGKLQQLPPLLAFSSAVDATVSTHDLVNGLFEQLPRGGHELVVFDLNRLTGMGTLLHNDPGKHITELLNNPDQNFTFTLMSNENGNSNRLVIRRNSPDSGLAPDSPTGFTWPTEIYSLAHVALPFPWDDPVYGVEPAKGDFGLPLGRLALRGERNVLTIPASSMLRLRSNPFYPYVEKRVVEFFKLAQPASD